MKNACKEWKDQLLEAALSGAEASGDLQEHLRKCESCTAELKNLEERRARLDELMPLVARGAEPSAGFRVRVLAAAEASSERKRASHWRAWTLAGATATAMVVLVVGVVWYRETSRKIPAGELELAQKLAEWRAPSDALLVTPGQEILRTTPKLGESYLKVPANKSEEER